MMENNLLRPSLQSCLQLLKAVSGDPLSANDISKPMYQSYISSVRQCMRDYDLAWVTIALCGPNPPTEAALVNGMFDLLVRLVEYTKDETEFSIDDAIDHLSSDHNIIHVDEDKQEQRNQARHLIFAALGWTSGLYRATAPNQSSQEELRIRSNALATSVSSLPLESCERPFSELLELLTGPFLLGRLSDTYDSSTDNDDAAQRTKLEDALAAEEFVVEHVNAATLHRLGGLKIVWVDDMISHLSFDRLSKELQLYRTPSLCKVQLGPNSLVAKLSEGVYSGANRAGSITHKKLFDEILLSYRLIFAEDRHSRKVYHKREQRMSYRWGTNDSTLNELCESVRADQESSADAKTPLASLFSRERWLTRATPTTFSFNKRRMFPILRPRLEQIQEYMLRRQPNQMWTLWIDRRDKPKWLTFWGVLIFGTLGVTMSFIQMLFAGLQVQIGYKSLECGCKS